MWPFPQKPAPLLDRRGLNEDWRAGDLAECMADGWEQPTNPHNPCKGDILRVSAITEGKFFLSGEPCALVTGLRFEGKPTNRAWHCRCFRKLRADHVSADAGFIALIRRVVRSPEPVAG